MINMYSLRTPRTTAELRAVYAAADEGVRIRARFLPTAWDDLPIGRTRSETPKQRERGRKGFRDSIRGMFHDSIRGMFHDSIRHTGE
jgi:hypothetical protein